MTDPRANELVHQVFFGWTYSQPTGKLDLRAWSLDDNDKKRWSARLKEHIRLQGADKPPHALSYIAFDDGTVAILRRVLIGHSDGRNNSHALIGSADVLTVTVALALDNWADWKNDPPQHYWMSSITASHFADVTDDYLATQMLPLIPPVEQAAGTVLARLLDKPHAPLSIIGCPVEHRLPLVWVLRGAADAYLRRNFGGSRRWSFSTHEARHDDAIQRLPEIVFLPAQPEGTGVANRTIVDLTSGREPAGVNAGLATTLVTQFLHKTPQREPVYEQPSPHDVYIPPQPPVTLPTAKTLDEFLAALGKLETSVFGVQQRRELRATLDVDTMNKISHFAENAARQELTRRVLTVAYGPQFTDLQQTDGLAHATDQIMKGESEYLARNLSKVVPQNGKNQVIAAAYHRWVAVDRPPVITPQPRNNKGRTNSRKKAARAGVTRVLTALAIAFIFGLLLGLLIGRPTQPAAESTPAPATTTTVPTSPQAGATGLRSASLPIVGRVTLAPGEKERVYSFVLFGDNTFYPQAPCHAVRQGGYQCVRNSTPPDPQPAVEPSLVAVIVPENQVDGLQDLAVHNGMTGKREGWGDTKIVERT